MKYTYSQIRNSNYFSITPWYFYEQDGRPAPIEGAPVERVIAFLHDLETLGNVMSVDCDLVNGGIYVDAGEDVAQYLPYCKSVFRQIERKAAKHGFLCTNVNYPDEYPDSTIAFTIYESEE